MKQAYIQQLVAVVLVATVGLSESFYAISGGIKFMSGVEFVGSILSMESTREPESWRAIDSPTIALIAYSLIWLAHVASGVLSLTGAYLLGHALKDGERYSQSAAVATAGVGIGCVLYLLGFQAIAGGWFLLYQAPTPPNFIPEAERIFLGYAAVLIYLHLVARQRTAA